MVVLDQDPGVQARAVRHAAAHLDRVLLQEAQERRRLPRVADLRAACPPPRPRSAGSWWPRPTSAAGSSGPRAPPVSSAARGAGHRRDQVPGVEAVALARARLPARSSGRAARKTRDGHVQARPPPAPAWPRSTPARARARGHGGLGGGVAAARRPRRARARTIRRTSGSRSQAHGGRGSRRPRSSAQRGLDLAPPRLQLRHPLAALAPPPRAWPAPRTAGCRASCPGTSSSASIFSAPCARRAVSAATSNRPAMGMRSSTASTGWRMVPAASGASATTSSALEAAPGAGSAPRARARNARSAGDRAPPR